ncbi:hypothetical protein [Streptomyces sp. NPDC014995]|uniref:hypothetical protein n=1 Tax=Streptomyces sp. NPDC014995 TaxID=3364936 RepID=UPI0036FA1168
MNPDTARSSTPTTPTALPASPSASRDRAAEALARSMLRELVGDGLCAGPPRAAEPDAATRPAGREASGR